MPSRGSRQRGSAVNATEASSAGLAGKTVLVTGGTAGIGFATAAALARKCARLIITGRDPQRGEHALSVIRQYAPENEPVFFSADFSDQTAVRRFAEKCLSENPRLDVLINNVGGLFGERQLSVDGIEMTLALNHLSYFMTTLLLLPGLKEAGNGRIVVVASEAHRGVTLDFDDPQGEMSYSRWTAYRRSKLANVMFTYELARRLEGTNVVANALHPGFVATEIGTRNRFVPSLFWKIGTLAAISPERGAKTSVYVASAAEVEGVSGQYFVSGKPAKSSSASYDADAQKRLWDLSANLTGVSL